jgi:PAS domain S-box-containing protein
MICCPFVTARRLYAFALNAGAVAMVGLLFAEIVSLLGMALASEREQRRQLALEKARSETLLQKEAEATLRASEEHFRSLIENASDAVAITDPSGVITYLGPSITRMLGYTPEALVGQHFAPIVHPDDRAAAGGALARAAENSGQAIASDIRILHKDGSWHTLESVSKRLPNGSVVSNVRDVSKRRAAEERLRESETLYRSLIENTSDGIAIIDSAGAFSYINPAYQRIWGWASDELIGQQFMQ